MAIRAHYDGKTIVLDESVNLPVNQPLEIEFRVLEDRRRVTTLAWLR